MHVPFLYPSVPDIQNLEHELKISEDRKSSQIGSPVHPAVFPLYLRPLGQTSPACPFPCVTAPT